MRDVARTEGDDNIVGTQPWDESVDKLFYRDMFEMRGRRVCILFEDVVVGYPSERRLPCAVDLRDDNFIGFVEDAGEGADAVSDTCVTVGLEEDDKAVVGKGAA